MAWLFRRKKYKFRETYRLWINRAPEASDILWENLAVDGAVGATHRAAAFAHAPRGDVPTLKLAMLSSDGGAVATDSNGTVVWHSRECSAG